MIRFINMTDRVFQEIIYRLANKRKQSNAKDRFKLIAILQNSETLNLF